MIHEIKADLKARALHIRETRKKMKEEMRAGRYSMQSDLFYEQRDFRHRHMAYCLLRGRKREEIEQKSNKPIDEDLLKSYLDGYSNHVRIKKGEFNRSAPDPKKLYVVVDDTLPEKYASVQAAHAVAEYMKSHKDWQNGTLVVVKASPVYLQSLAKRGWTQFTEPDLDCRLTAVSHFQEKNWLVQDLRLL